MFNVFIIGPAGSGKSTLTHSLSQWLLAHDIDVVRVNLDPAVEKLPYEPDVDVREWVRADFFMEKYGLGPNGAIIASVDYMATQIEKIREEVLSSGSGYVIFDTPGQMELFVFRDIGEYLISQLSEKRSCIIFILDAVVALRASSFVSSLLLSASVFYRFHKPMINVLNKIDFINGKYLEKILGWIDNPEELHDELRKELVGTKLELSTNIYETIKEYLDIFNVLLVSAKTGAGIDTLYTVLQQIYLGGEDYIVLP